MHEDIGGMGTGPMVELLHDGNGDGAYDDGGWQGGDSGGPCYFRKGDGVRVAGNVTGTIKWWPWVPKSYYCSQLKGVRVWNGSARVR